MSLLNRTLEDIWDAQTARQGYDRAIDKMEAKIASMHAIPDWGVGLIIGLALVAFVCCLQLLIMMLTMPCMYSWDYCWEARRQRLRDEQFTANDPDDPDARRARSRNDRGHRGARNRRRRPVWRRDAQALHQRSKAQSRKNGKARVSEPSYDMND